VSVPLGQDIGDVAMEEVCQALGKPCFTTAVQEEVSAWSQLCCMCGAGMRTGGGASMGGGEGMDMVWAWGSGEVGFATLMGNGVVALLALHCQGWIEVDSFFLFTPHPHCVGPTHHLSLTQRARRSKGSRSPGAALDARAPPVPRRGAWYSTRVVLMHDPMFGVDVDHGATARGRGGVLRLDLPTAHTSGSGRGAGAGFPCPV
jgi:hypothetical protein